MKKFVPGELVDLTEGEIAIERRPVQAGRNLSLEERSLAISQANTDTSASHDLKRPKLAPTDVLQPGPTAFKSPVNAMHRNKLHIQRRSQTIAPPTVRRRHIPNRTRRVLMPGPQRMNQLHTLQQSLMEDTSKYALCRGDSAQLSRMIQVAQGYIEKGSVRT